MESMGSTTACALTAGITWDIGGSSGGEGAMVAFGGSAVGLGSE